MWAVFEFLIPSNVGVSLESIILLGANLGLLVFYAKNFKLGVLMGFMINGITFLGFYQFELNWVLPLILIFMNLIIMSLTLYSVNKVDSGRGGFV